MRLPDILTNLGRPVAYFPAPVLPTVCPVERKALARWMATNSVHRGRGSVMPLFRADVPAAGRLCF